MLFYCHNCHASMQFGNFLKMIDPELHKEYVQEKFIDKNTTRVEDSKPDITRFEKPKFITESPLKDLKKISQLPWDHPAKKYVLNREIPSRQHAKLFFVPRFKKWVNKFIPDKFDLTTDDEPRLIIPLIDKNKNCFGIQGRSFKPDGIRYITIIFDESIPKVFGLDDADFSKTLYVTEGPFDSMFLPNAIAMAGSDGVNVVDSFNIDRGRVVFVYDNEPRNKDIVRIMDKVIDRGYNVCFWPDSISQKDINEMVMGGMKPDDIKHVIDSNTYNGLQAKMKMTTWRKI